MIKKPVKVPVSAQAQNAADQKRIRKELEKKMQLETRLMQYLALIVAAIGFILYFNTLDHQYALDDNSLIVENASTKKGFAGLTEIFKTSYRFGYIDESAEAYRPLSKAMFAIEWALTPNKPFLSHLMNVLLFSLTGFIIVITLYKYFNSVSLAFISGLLFISHPIHTEVVANIKSRDEILVLLFSLLTLLAIKIYMDKGKLVWTLIASFSFFLALLSKESAITFIGVFMLIWYFFYFKELKKYLVPFSGILISLLLFLLIRSGIVESISQLNYTIAENPLVAASDKAHYYATAIYILGYYVKLLFIPFPLVVDYSFNQVPVIGLNDWKFWASLFVLLITFTVSLLYFRKRQAWSFGILFFIITISVTSNLFFMIGTNIAERLLYTPSLGFCIVIAFVFLNFFKQEVSSDTVKNYFYSNRKGVFLTGILVVWFSLMTIARNKDWKNDVTLFSHDVKVATNSARCHFLLASCLMKSELNVYETKSERDSILKLAKSELNQSIAIYPEYADAWNHMGSVNFYLGDMEQAKHDYETAVNYKPEDAVMHHNLGSAYYALGNYPEAEKLYRKAILMNPNYVEAYVNLGNVLGMQKRYDEAFVNYNKAIQLDPSDPNPWHVMGVTYDFLGNEEMANNCFNKEEELKSIIR